jgi:hypothetical protein
MDRVPLDLQRKCERRWASRYQRPQDPVTTPERGFKKQDQQQAGSTGTIAKQKLAEFSGWFEVVVPRREAIPKPRASRLKRLEFESIATEPRHGAWLGK